MVAMPDAVLVAHKDRAQIKSSRKAQGKGCSPGRNPARDYRPWGWYESIALGRGSVKRIVVNPEVHFRCSLTIIALSIGLWWRAQQKSQSMTTSK